MDQQKNVTQVGALLQSKEHRDLLDIIDRLRSQGISQYVDLPQIIVCGDQSSGKSSVLEAISGMSFPTKDNLCTRFATELILRRSPTEGLEVHISPGPDRSSDEKKKLQAFEYTHNVLDIGRVVEDAKDAMGLNGNDKVFGTDILRIEISGPTQPHLTMVDLPGLFLAGNKDQTEQDSKLVKSLVLEYMSKPRSIILAVVSAKNDFALQQVTQHARALDPKGIRTLGLITKPDTLDEGSDSEKFFVELAKNKDVEFLLGWHVLLNRSYAMRHASTLERDSTEIDFFSKGIWTVLEESQLGVAALRVRLSNVLRDQIVLQLPSVLEDVKTGIKQCEDNLAKLGSSRASVSEQRRYLIKASTRFSSLVKAAIDGVYADVFFTRTYGPQACSGRVRAVVQNILTEFAEQMRTEGHARIIEEGPIFDGGDDRFVSRTDYLNEVKALMKETRGRELPGTYNPLLVAELFSNQCQPWKGLVCSLSDRVFGSAYIIVSCMIQNTADERTAEALLSEIVGPSMETLKETLNAKVEELLEPYISGHPITYNHYLTDNVQKAQAVRHRRELESRMKYFFQKDELTQVTTIHSFNMSALLDALVSHIEPDMDKFSCSMATDMMQAYYKVALKKVVDDVSILAIERCLILKLPHLFSPEVVCDLTDLEVQHIAGESDELVTERVHMMQKLNMLESGMTELKRLRKYNPSMLQRSLTRKTPPVAQLQTTPEELTRTELVQKEPAVFEATPEIVDAAPVALEEPEPMHLDDIGRSARTVRALKTAKKSKKGRVLMND